MTTYFEHYPSRDVYWLSDDRSTWACAHGLEMEADPISIMPIDCETGEPAKGRLVTAAQLAAPTAPTARFWVYARHGYVRLSLRPGQSLHWAHGGRTDEGWSCHAETWSYDGETVTNDIFDDGCDCDGRMSSGGTLICPRERLSVHPARHLDSDGEFSEDPATLLPDWDCAARWQRDHQAEAAGY